ncbi:MAG: aldehyde dehydrogenase family protein [Myxococcota bacterium]
MIRNLIDGSWTSAPSTLDNLRPGDGTVQGTLPKSGPEEINAAVSAAGRAFPAWAKRSREERAALLDRVADGLEARAEELAALESADTGKPIRTAREIDIPRAIANFRFFAGAIRHTREDAHHMPGALNYTLRQPLGVVGLITPWNLPLYLLSWKTAPALAMGNTIVAKPSELTPSTATALGEIMLDVGLPAGVFNIVHGTGTEAGAALVDHPNVSAISFTGGTATGRVVGAAAAAGFKKMSLELGGKNPTVVFADADLDKAIHGLVRAAFTNQGQVCLCGSRILVERSIFDEVVERAVERVRAMRIGDPADPSTDLGALISEAHRDKVESYVQLARDEGGTIVTGGRRPDLPGYFLEPTLITGVSPECRAATEEIFGPVATLHPFDSEEEAVAMANGVSYGLAASLWTQNLTRAHRVSAAIETGMVWVNTWLNRDLRVPFGGVKASGVSREGGEYSLGFYSEAKNICVQLEEPAPVAKTIKVKAPAQREASGSINSGRAPKPVGAYPHARRHGDLLMLSGVGPRSPEDNSVPGGPIHNEAGQPLAYDIEAQTRAVIENVRVILEDSGASLDHLLDIQVFLIDMKRDFPGFNKVYKELLGAYGATRTTIAIRALPTPIAVEFKVIARAPGN